LQGFFKNKKNGKEKNKGKEDKDKEEGEEEKEKIILPPPLRGGAVLYFMRISIKATNLKLTPDITTFIKKKIGALERFSRVIKEDKPQGRGRSRVEAWVEIGKETRHHRKGPYFRAECQIKVPKRSLRAVAEEEDLRMAIRQVKEAIEKQIKKYKEQIMAKRKKITSS